jgi:hypothetical protein
MGCQLTQPETFITTDTNTNGYEILVLAHRMTLAVLRDDGVAYGDFIAKREGAHIVFLGGGGVLAP